MVVERVVALLELEKDATIVEKVTIAHVHDRTDIGVRQPVHEILDRLGGQAVVALERAVGPLA